MGRSMEIGIEVARGEEASGEVVLDVEYKVTSGGSPAHMGSLNYPGHPAEPMEIEIEHVFWPYFRRTKEGERPIKVGDCPEGWTLDHVDMPLSALPDSVLEAIEDHIVENDHLEE